MNTKPENQNKPADLVDHDNHHDDQGVHHHHDNHQDKPADKNKGGVKVYSALRLRNKHNDPESERLAKAIERGMCE